MQESWRRDADKLTFIICSPSLPGIKSDGMSQASKQLSETITSCGRMIGDVNLFLRLEDEEPTQDGPMPELSQDPKQQLVGELELMIAEKDQRRQGYGRAALLCFMKYILEHESSVVDEFFSQTTLTSFTATRKISYFSVKIGEGNAKSLTLFETLGFQKVTEKANVFGELELIMNSLRAHWLQDMLEKHSIRDYSEASSHKEFT
jgi:hypothetical protein